MLVGALMCVLNIYAFGLDDLSETSEVLNGYNKSEVKTRLSAMPLDDMEGMWQFPVDGALVVVERFVPESHRDDGVIRYRLVIVQSPRLSVRPGTVMGYMIPSAKKNFYDALIYTSFDGGTALYKPKKFILKHSDEANLSFVEHKTGLKVNLWRMVPYMFRYSITKQDTRPEDMNGCVKVYPQKEGSVGPKYL